VSSATRRTAAHQLLVLAKRPAPGRCKQRLAKTLGDQAAARVQQRLLEHTMAVARLWRHSDPAGSVALLFAEHQGHGSLGQRLQRLMGRSLRQGARQVVVVGSDLPSLSPLLLRQAFAGLDQQPLVLGPALDGGYGLIGLTAAGFAQQRGRLFSGIPWGGDQVLSCTQAQAKAQAMGLQLLSQQRDLDRITDLEPWCAEP